MSSRFTSGSSSLACAHVQASFCLPFQQAFLLPLGFPAQLTCAISISSFFKLWKSSFNPLLITGPVLQKVACNLLILKSSWKFSIFFLCDLCMVIVMVSHASLVKSFSFGCRPTLSCYFPSTFQIILYLFFTGYSVFPSHLGLVFPRIVVFYFFSCLQFIASTFFFFLSDFIHPSGFQLESIWWWLWRKLRCNFSPEFSLTSLFILWTHTVEFSTDNLKHHMLKMTWLKSHSYPAPPNNNNLIIFLYSLYGWKNLVYLQFLSLSTTALCSHNNNY